MEVSGSVSVSAKELYELYTNSMTQSTECKIMSKNQVGCIVPRLFKKIKVVQNRGLNTYQGLRLNFLQDKDCDINDINSIAAENVFLKMNSTGSCKYGLLTGQCVNKIEVMEVIEIKSDKTWKLFVAGRDVDVSIIGLTNMTCQTYFSIKTIFNTIKQAKMCREKVVNSKMATTKYRCV